MEGEGAMCAKVVRYEHIKYCGSSKNILTC